VAPTVAQLMREVRIAREARRFPEALAAIEQAIAVAPSDAGLLVERAVLLRAAGRSDEAREAARSAVKLAPTSAEAQAQLGLGYLDQGKASNAEGAFKLALQYDRANASALGGYGALRLKQGRLAEAESFAMAAVRGRHRDSGLLVQLGDVFAARSNSAGMIEAYRRAHEADDQDVVALEKYLAAKQTVGGVAAARAALEEAASRTPNQPRGYVQLGRFLSAHGMLGDAASSYRRALDIDPMAVEALQFLSGSTRLRAREDEDFKRLTGGYELSQRDSRDRSSIGFALAKALDDVGDYAGAFDLYLEANEILWKAHPYDLARDDRAFREIAQTFDADLMSRFRAKGQSSGAPIFIVGMPRSGTTLTETILSRHPDIYAAGELESFRLLATAVGGANPIFEAQLFIDRLNGGVLREIGSAYLSRLPDAARKKKQVTDKMPHNFRLIGLIRLVFPNARIVHVRRDVVDTCLSMFKANFEMPDLGFTNNLTTLGRYHNLYRRLMNHWRAVLPGQFFEIDYEALVSDPETSTKALFDYCGLDWSPDVLQVEKSTREVVTASFAQVRQPINTRSVSAAARYGDRLDPLRAALAEYDG